jgi:glucosamine--fructose-6-phosphate aminotransferase (isomerizing)
MKRIGATFRELSPQVIVTCARGSSDHAATYGKYLIETQAGVPTLSAAPSVSSVYLVKPKMRDAVFVAISQSGKSPDLLAAATAAKDAGALVVALVNVPESPLTELADEVVPLHAGVETSVAATKSFIATLSALVHLVAEWTDNIELMRALNDLPKQLKLAWALDWSEATDALVEASNFFVIGRGVGFGIAQEAALKFKETAGLHAEAYSAAEVQHGPMAIVEKGFPVLVFVQDDETQQGLDTIIGEFVSREAKVIVAGRECERTINLPWVVTESAPTAPILLIQTFYRMANALSVARGFNPDCPPHIRKVTETV